MENKLSVNDIPADVLEKLYAMVEESDAYKRKVAEHRKLLQGRRYVEAVGAKQELDEIKRKTVQMYLDKWEGETRAMNDLLGEMPKEEREELHNFTTAISFLCDMIEVYAMDAEELFNRYNPDWHISSYNTLLDLAKECKRQIRQMDEHADIRFSTLFGDFSDDMKRLLDNKVKSLRRKYERSVKAGKQT